MDTNLNKYLNKYSNKKMDTNLNKYLNKRRYIVSREKVKFDDIDSLPVYKETD